MEKYIEVIEYKDGSSNELEYTSYEYACYWAALDKATCDSIKNAYAKIINEGAESNG